MSAEIAGDKTAERARRIVLATLQGAIEYCLEIGFEKEVIQDGIKSAAAFLLSCGEPEKPSLHIVWPPEMQLTLPFDVVGPTAERFGPEFEPDKTAAKLAAGWRSWHKCEGEAS